MKTSWWLKWRFCLLDPDVTVVSDSLLALAASGCFFSSLRQTQFSPSYAKLTVSLHL